MKSRSLFLLIGLLGSYLLVGSGSVFGLTSLTSSALSSGALPTEDTALQFLTESIVSSLSNAQDIASAKVEAEKFIASLQDDDVDWRGEKPKLTGKAIPYYSDDENTPIGYEWKISCDTKKDCGSVTISAVDGVYELLRGATFGVANYEKFSKGKESRKNKLYYYGFDNQYIESTDKNGKSPIVESLDPNIGVIDAPKKLKQHKEEFKVFRKEFREKRAKEKNQLKQKTQSEEVYMDGYAQYGSVSNSITGASQGSCGGPLPCYAQNSTTINGATCQNGCGPTAMAIIFGFYDRYSVYPNLVSGTASSTVQDATMISKLQGYMGTVCQGTEGATAFNKISLGMKYAQEKGYSGAIISPLTSGTGGMSAKIRAEINKGRPLIINSASASAGHIMVTYAYDTYSNSALDPLNIKVNFGWGGYVPDQYVPLNNTITVSPISGQKFISVLPVIVQP